MNTKNVAIVLHSITNFHNLTHNLTEVVRDLEEANLPDDQDVCHINKTWVRGMILGHVATVFFYLDRHESDVWARETSNFIFANCKPGLTKWSMFESDWIFRLILDMPKSE